MSNLINNNPSIVSNTLTSFWNKTEESGGTGQDSWWNKSESTTGTANSNNGASVYNTVSQGYGIDYINQLTEAANAAFVGLGLGEHDRVTFNRITEYTDKLKEDFASQVKEGLEELGVSDDAVYQIVSNYTGEGVNIVTDSEDSAKISQFFSDNPEMVDMFEQIQYLDNLEQSRSNTNIQAHLEISRIQLQTMSGLFSTSPSSSIMSFGAGNTYFGTGFSTIV